jgi:DNA-binding HxlR family transcriptional regulator
MTEPRHDSHQWQQGARKCYTYLMDTVEKADTAPEVERLVRELLDRVADKWTLLLIEALEDGEPVRFTRLRERVTGVSQKMLTKTLRQLERDGLVTRCVHPVIPPHVDYTLTPMGLSLGEAVCGIWLWVGANADAVELARQAYAAREQLST